MYICYMFCMCNTDKIRRYKFLRYSNNKIKLKVITELDGSTKSVDGCDEN